MAALKFPERLDLFWISQNYHDLHDRFMGPVDVKAFNRADATWCSIIPPPPVRRPM